MRHRVQWVNTGSGILGTLKQRGHGGGVLQLSQFMMDSIILSALGLLLITFWWWMLTPSVLCEPETFPPDTQNLFFSLLVGRKEHANLSSADEASPSWTQPCLILLRPETIEQQYHLYLISSPCQVA